MTALEEQLKRVEEAMKLPGWRVEMVFINVDPSYIGRTTIDSKATTPDQLRALNEISDRILNLGSVKK